MEVQRGKETSLHGRLEGVKVTDLTEAGKKYRDIISMGNDRIGGSEGEREGWREGERERQTELDRGDNNGQHSQFLNFSVHISQRSNGSSNANDVSVTLFIPPIHYTHSVNIIQEMELFVSEFHELSRAVMQSFSSAAVVMAKGIVNEKSQFAEQLSTSLGPRLINLSMPPTGEPEIESIDAPLDSSPARDHLYLNISIQSPVIVLPSHLHGDKCLIAYLGEISIENKFTSENSNVSLSKSIDDVHSPIEREIITLKIINISLHATHDVKSRMLLIANGGNSDKVTSGGLLWKVIQETSIALEVERRLEEGRGGREGGGGRGGWRGDRANYRENLDTGEDKVDKAWDDGSKDASEGDRVNDRDILEAGDEEATEPQNEKDAPNVCDTVSDDVVTDVMVTGKICDPLLIQLPKDVFDQIRVTLKHSLYKSLPRKRRGANTKMTSPPSGRSKVISQSVTSSQSSQTLPKSEQSLKTESHSPTISVNFSLPRLSLELKHRIDSRERDLVYISFDEFTMCCRKSRPHETSIDLALKRIVIEDLLQEEQSEYRYLLSSSTKPFPGLSPMGSGSSVRLRGLSVSPSHLSPFTTPLLTRSSQHTRMMMSSTPRVSSLTLDSPLRLFKPRPNTSTETSQTSFKPVSVTGQTGFKTCFFLYQ